MDPGLGKVISQLTPRLIRIRRDLHRYLELEYQETRTAQTVLTELQPLGLPPRLDVVGTGIVDHIEGAEPGPTGMHACGTTLTRRSSWEPWRC